jgi:integrase
MLTKELIGALLNCGKAAKRSDGGGLYLSVGSGGKARWYLAYRFGGVQRSLRGGSYPETSIDKARVWRAEVKAQLKLGFDPQMIADTNIAQVVSEVTFEELATEWMRKKSSDWSSRYAVKVNQSLKNDIFPHVGKKPASTITVSDMLAAMKRIEARGANFMAHRARSICNQIFRFGVPDGRVTNNPCRDLDVAMCRRPRVKNYARLPVKDFPRFFSALNSYSGSRIVQLAIRWTIMTMVRTTETRFAEWQEFEGLDGDKPIWRIPATRMKMHHEHVVPLPPQAVLLLREIKEQNILGMDGHTNCGRYLFPSPRSSSNVISRGTMMYVVNCMNLGDFTIHGFRAVASSVLNESGLFSPDWIELQLAHVPAGARGIYNKALYLDHRRKMLAWWAQYLEAAENASLDIEHVVEPLKHKEGGAVDWLHSQW